MNVHVTNDEMNFSPAGSNQELNVGGEVATPAALPAGTTHAMICVKTNAVLMAFGGNPATGGRGIQLASGTRMILRKYALENARFIEATGGQAAVIAIEHGTF